MSDLEKNIPILYDDVCQIINGARTRIATTVNSEVCWMNWLIGKRIKEDVLYNQRAEYGKAVVKKISLLLTDKYGKGWSIYKLQHCVRSAYTFSEDEIVYALRTQLTFIISLKLLKTHHQKLKNNAYLFASR